jgi:hypothetical protein
MQIYARITKVARPFAQLSCCAPAVSARPHLSARAGRIINAQRHSGPPWSKISDHAALSATLDIKCLIASHSPSTYDHAVSMSADFSPGNATATAGFTGADYFPALHRRD